jgi:hypothetical protein
LSTAQERIRLLFELGVGTYGDCRAREAAMDIVEHVNSRDSHESMLALAVPFMIHSIADLYLP